ncbi:hypothetical protein [Streptomyces sp. NPDC059468]|uniref:hypothetical protein n=1 Tax=Streptomyces sp. NPDC059468 TaxID=3346845 RepID=UPI0036A409B3
MIQVTSTVLPRRPHSASIRSVLAMPSSGRRPGRARGVPGSGRAYRVTRTGADNTVTWSSSDTRIVALTVQVPGWERAKESADR